MSQEQALQFIQKANRDSALQQQLAAVPEDDLAGIVRIGAQAGFRFSAEEFQAAMQTFDQDYRSTMQGTDDKR